MDFLDLVARCGGTTEKARSVSNPTATEHWLVEVWSGEKIYDVARHFFTDGNSLITTDGYWDSEGLSPYSTKCG